MGQLALILAAAMANTWLSIPRSLSLLRTGKPSFTSSGSSRAQPHTEKPPSSGNLVNIASHHHPHTSIIADNLFLPHRPSIFDFAISIAIVHHLSTPARRVQAIAAILETLRPSTNKGSIGGADYKEGGRTLIYVWALEQRHSRRGWDEGDEQDVMVPWVMKQKIEGGNDVEQKTFNRYYHLYRHGELEQDIVSGGGMVVESGYEKDNWWAIAVRVP